MSTDEESGRPLRGAVVGHVEWVEFLRVPRVPGAGEIVHASSWWEEPAGGGAGAAVQLLKLCDDAIFYTALGDDELGHRSYEMLSDRGLKVETTFQGSTRRAVTHIDDDGERTITVLGERLAPSARDPLVWDRLAEVDAVYFTAGDVDALRLARKARVLVVTARILPVLAASGVEVDALVGSHLDPAEQYARGALDPAPLAVVRTRGAEGGTVETPAGTIEHFPAPPVPGPIVDRYGAGDSFAAALAYGLASGLAPVEAAGVAARCGAAVLTGRGPYEAQLHRRDLDAP